MMLTDLGMELMKKDLSIVKGDVRKIEDVTEVLKIAGKTVDLVISGVGTWMPPVLEYQRMLTQFQEANPYLNSVSGRR